MTWGYSIAGREFGRWSFCAAVMLSLHAAAIAGIVGWQTERETDPETSGAIVVELAPEATTAIDAAANASPLPPQVATAATPPPRDPPKEPNREPPDELPLNDTAQVVLPQPAITLPPEPPEVPVSDAAAAEAATPQSLPAPQAAVATAPAAGSGKLENSAALPLWTRKIALVLERNKRFPASARTSREQGTALVTFVIDRQGRLLSSRVAESSGITALDHEALELLQRAQPFPPLPPEITTQQITLNVPIRFALH